MYIKKIFTHNNNIKLIKVKPSIRIYYLYASYNFFGLWLNYR